MPTPESGTATVDTSSNLGDVSKLDFLNNLDESGNIVTDKQTTDDGQELLDERDGTEIEEGKSSSGADSGQAQVVTDQGVITPNKKSRDYTGIPEELIPVFKGMSNDAYKHATEWYKKFNSEDTKYKELEGSYNKVKDLQYYQHPEAYRLSDDYSGMVKQYNNHNTKINYYRQALIAVNKGQPIKDLIVDKDGNITGVSNEDLPPSEELKAQIQDAIDTERLKAHDIQGKLNNYKTDYTTRHKQFDDFLVQMEGNLLGEMRKHEEFKTLEKSMLEIIPPELRGSRQYQLLAGMGAFIKSLVGEVNRLNGLVKGKQTVRKTVQSAGPGDGQGTNGNENVDPKKFLAELRRYRGFE